MKTLMAIALSLSTGVWAESPVWEPSPIPGCNDCYRPVLTVEVRAVRFGAQADPLGPGYPVHLVYSKPRDIFNQSTWRNQLREHGVRPDGVFQPLLFSSCDHNIYYLPHAAELRGDTRADEPDKMDHRQLVQNMVHAVERAHVLGIPLRIIVRAKQFKSRSGNQQFHRCAIIRVFTKVD